MGIEPTRRQHESLMHGGFICCLGVPATTRNAWSPAWTRRSPSCLTRASPRIVYRRRGPFLHSEKARTGSLHRPLTRDGSSEVLLSDYPALRVCDDLNVRRSALARPRMLSPKGPGSRESDMAVLEFQSPTGALIAAPAPSSANYVAFIIGSFVVLALAGAFIVKLDKVVAGEGKLVSKVPTIMMQPLQTSIVRNIYVRRGQVVHKGQLLAQLDPTFSAADSQADQEQVDSYTAQIERLSAQISSRPYSPNASNPQSGLQLQAYDQLQSQYQYGVKNFDQQIVGLEATLAKAQADIDQFSKRLAISSNVEHMRDQLQQMQVGSQLDTLAAADSRLGMAGSLADAQAAAKQAIGSIASIVAQRGAFIQQWFSNLSQQLQQAQNSLATAQQSLTKDTKVHQLVELRADQDAVVLNLAHVSQGSVLQSGQQFLSLVPLNAPVEAEIVVDGTGSGYVSVGDPVKIKLKSLPYMIYGSIKGHISWVSPDSFDQQDLQNGVITNITGAPPSDLFYEARVAFDHDELHRMPPGFVLTPGMPVDADVKVGQRRIITYMLRRIMPSLETQRHSSN
jgi:hemolysin D